MDCRSIVFNFTRFIFPLLLFVWKLEAAEEETAELASSFCGLWLLLVFAEPTICLLLITTPVLVRFLRVIGTPNSSELTSRIVLVAAAGGGGCCCELAVLFMLLFITLVFATFLVERRGDEDALVEIDDDVDVEAVMDEVAGATLTASTFDSFSYIYTTILKKISIFCINNRNNIFVEKIK